MSLKLFLIILSVVIVQNSLFAMDRLYITAAELSKNPIVGNIKLELGLSNNKYLEWLSVAIEDRNYNAAIKTIQNLPKFKRGMDTEEANKIITQANLYLKKSASSSNKKIALISASTGIMLDNIFFTISNEKKDPYIVDFLKVYQKYNICYGFIREANLISSTKFKKNPEYKKALELLDMAKGACSIGNAPKWEVHRREVLKMLITERFKIMKSL